MSYHSLIISKCRLENDPKKGEDGKIRKTIGGASYF